jgi:hypothetical protein
MSYEKIVKELKEPWLQVEGWRDRFMIHLSILHISLAYVHPPVFSSTLPTPPPPLVACRMLCLGGVPVMQLPECPGTGRGGTAEARDYAPSGGPGGGGEKK